MKQEFEIIKINDKQMTLVPFNKDGCLSCDAKNVCGSGILGKYFDKSIVKPLGKSKRIGDKITLEIQSKTLFSHAFKLYIIPLLLLFSIGVISSIFFKNNETYQIFFSLIGFFASFFIIKMSIKN